MNGRIYDPVIGKMMSADPTVPNPVDAQSYNRYAYVGNNPLSFTDPTGFSSCGACGMMQVGYGDDEFDYHLTASDWAAMVKSAVPVAGPASDAMGDFKEGHYGWGMLNAAMAALDAVTLGADEEVSGPVKTVIKGARIIERAKSVARAGQTAFKDALKAAGKLHPGQQAHHIVELTSKFAERSQKILKDLEVDLNSVVNGVGLSCHCGRHSKIYSDAVFDELKDVKTKKEAEAVLNKISDEQRAFDKQGKTPDDWARDHFNNTSDDAVEHSTDGHAADAMQDHLHHE